MEINIDILRDFTNAGHSVKGGGLTLSERQQWVLHYVADVRGGVGVGTCTYFDDGIAFVGAYAKRFLDLSDSTEKCRRSLRCVLRQLEIKGLLRSENVSNGGWGGRGGDHPPSHSNVYRTRPRGRRLLETTT